jgi:syndecan 1
VAAPQASALAVATLTPGPAVPPAGTVPVVRREAGTPGAGPAAGGGTGRAATPVQRDVTGTGGTALPAGAPAGTPPAHGRPRSASVPSASSAPGRDAARHAGAPQDPGPDLDDLARRLLDPMARLLRTELRRGRDRTGRPYDGRR